MESKFLPVVHGLVGYQYIKEAPNYNPSFFKEMPGMDVVATGGRRRDEERIQRNDK